MWQSEYSWTLFPTTTKLYSITNYTALVVYASNTFSEAGIDQDDDNSSAQWYRDFRRIITSVNITSHEITSLLALLSSSITNGQPLPPYMATPEAYRLSVKMEAVDRDILSLRHIAEPGYAAFAVMQISTRCISMDIEKLMVYVSPWGLSFFTIWCWHCARAVKRLVGELDFSFHTVSTQASSESTSSDTLFKSSSRRSKMD